MPIFRFPFDQKETNRLERLGPVIPVLISLPEAVAEFRASKGQHIPAPIRGMALLDTGAYASAVDVAVFETLSIQAIDVVRVVTPGGNANFEAFPASFSIPELKVPQMEMERVFGCRLGWDEKRDDSLLMLIGRDILKKFLIVYDGVHDELLIGH